MLHALLIMCVCPSPSQLQNKRISDIGDSARLP